MNNLYDALENCLHDIENGAELEAVLLRYSDIADELRPVIQASVDAKSLAVPNPSADVMRRNRARLLQRASEIRAAKVESLPRFVWPVPLVSRKGRNETSGISSMRRVAITLIVLVVLFASGTNLVRAASTALPGDNLYPVKRTWEDVTLLLTIDLQKRASLEVEHEEKRLQEVHELFAKGRSAKVDFTGRVTRQNADVWWVAGFPILISPETDMPDAVAVGAAVRVIGFTQSNGMVRCEGVELLPPGVSLPTGEQEIYDGSDHSGNEAPGSGSQNEAPDVEETKTPEPLKPQMESFDGVLQSMDVNDIWAINGVVADVSNAEIIGTPVIGAAARVDGYFNSNGLFIVTRIVFADTADPVDAVEAGSNSGSGSNSNDNENTGGSGNENNNSNDNENTNDNENSNDSSGPSSGGGNDNGDDNNSGPGGGGGDDENDNNSGSGSGGDDNSSSGGD